MTSTGWTVALALCPPFGLAGMAAALYGRLRIRRMGDAYRGPAIAWWGYLGGSVLTAAAAVVFLIAAVMVVRSAVAAA